MLGSEQKSDLKRPVIIIVEPLADKFGDYEFPSGSLQVNQLAYSGRIKVNGEDIVTGPGARLRMRLQARNVHLVLGGKGEVRVFFEGTPYPTVHVNGSRLYTLADFKKLRSGLLELWFSPGIRAYAFTFG